MLTHRSFIAGLAVVMGLTGVVQAEPLNIWSASRDAVAAPSAQIENVQYRRYHRRGGINPGAAIAIGTIGAIAGAAAVASSRDRYYRCDPYYEYCGNAPRRVYRDYDGYRPNRPNNYPTDMD